jgi:hypothetical protein
LVGCWCLPLVICCTGFSPSGLSTRRGNGGFADVF